MAATKKKPASATKKPAAKQTSKTAPAKPDSARKPVRRGVGALVCVLLAAFSLIGFSSSDALFIAFFRAAARGLVGSGYIALPLLLWWCAVTLAFHRGRPVAFRVTCTLLLTIVAAAAVHLFAFRFPYDITASLPRELWSDGQFGAHGGLIGGFLAVSCEKLFSKTGAAIVFAIIGIFLVISATGRTLVELVDAFKNRPRREYEPEPTPAPGQPPRRASAQKPVDTAPVSAPEPKTRKRPVIDLRIDEEPGVAVPEVASQPEFDPGFDTFKADDGFATDPDDDILLEIPFMEDDPVRPAEPAPKPVKRSKNSGREPEMREPEIREPEIYTTFDDEVLDNTSPPDSEYEYPPVTLLTANNGDQYADGSMEIRMNTDLLEQAFKDFGVAARISNVTRGPSVTRYEAELRAGVKLSSLTRLTDDLALAIGASGIRIGAMPNKRATVSIEVPNKHVSMVCLRDIIDSPEFRDAPSKLTFALGKNIPGEAITGNISKLTHLLIAGTTGSGKSVCLNSLILSLLYKSTPEEVRFIMIDPKMVEFGIYNGIPHLLVPVVTDTKKASGALQWAVVEMEKRYKYFSEHNVRDLESYNRLIMSKGEKRVPQMLIIIDELSDLMMSSKNEVEDSIVRIAQKGRASGIHLVLATQSPRSNVITGLMKANLPSRIALKVSSALESSIILSPGSGAEKLVGYGDMLYAPNNAKPIRVQGTNVTDEEREAVINFVKRSGEAEYSDDVINEIERAAVQKDKRGSSDDGEESGYVVDEMLPQAADVIFDTGQASTSMLQRRLRLGYARAARIIDQLEDVGLLGPFEGSKARQILLTREQWKTTRFGGGSGGGQAAAAPGDDEVEPDYDDDDTPPWVE